MPKWNENHRVWMNRLRSQNPFPARRLVFSPGSVYLLLDTSSGLHKIGCTSCLKARMSRIKRDCRGNSELVHAIKTNSMFFLEREAHMRFLASHQTGEWFSLSREQIEAFCSVGTVEYAAVKKCARRQ